MSPEVDGDKKIFRAGALAAAGGGNRLHALSPIISPRLWVLTSALAFLLATIVAWGFMGRIPITVIGTGIFLRGERMDTCNTFAQGHVSEVRKREGDRVQAGECIAIVAAGPSDSDGQPTEALSPVSGRVVSIEVEVGDFVTSGRVVAVIASGSDAPRCIAFIPLSEGKCVVVGMPVRLEFSTADALGAAQAVGHVDYVDSFITSEEKMHGRVPNPTFVDAIRQQYGPVMAVTVLLDADPAGGGGVKWNSGKGAAGLLIDGAPCDIEITIGEIRPVALIMPELDSQTRDRHE